MSVQVDSGTPHEICDLRVGSIYQHLDRFAQRSVKRLQLFEVAGVTHTPAWHKYETVSWTHCRHPNERIQVLRRAGHSSADYQAMIRNASGGLPPASVMRLHP